MTKEPSMPITSRPASLTTMAPCFAGLRLMAFGLAAVMGWTSTVGLAAQGGAKKVTLASPWRGEALVGATGVATLTMIAVSPTKTSPDLTSAPVKIFLQRGKALVIIRYSFPTGFSRSMPMWKLPSGRYTLIKVTAADRKGRLWQWRADAKGGPKVMVAAGMVATLGRWQITPFPKGVLKVGRVGKAAGTIGPRDKAKLRSARGIMNGLTGKVLAKWGPAKKTGKAKRRKKVIGVFSRTKKIGVFYGIALPRHKSQVPAMTRLLRRHDLAFRNCYMKSLRFDPNVAGKVLYRFQVSPRDRLIEPALVGRGGIKDKRLLRCLYYEISSLKVPMKLPLTNGSIAFTFMTSLSR